VAVARLAAPAARGTRLTLQAKAGRLRDLAVGGG